MLHILEPSPDTTHRCFSREVKPALTIAPGDTVRARTPDATGYRRLNLLFDAGLPEIARDPSEPGSHTLCGPIAVQGAEPGDILEVRVDAIQPSAWGWTSSGPFGAGRWLGLTEEAFVGWALDVERGVAEDTNGLGLRVPMRPFLGILGNAPDEPGMRSTIPPRRTGGNLDCRELVAGSALRLPVAVEDALFFFGDGHAAQGDGEVAGPAIEAAFDQVDLTFTVIKGRSLEWPQALTPAGFITFGFGESLDEAMRPALAGMIAHIQETYGLSKNHAVALATATVSLRVTQIVNGTVGVHALLPKDAFTREPGAGRRALSGSKRIPPKTCIDGAISRQLAFHHVEGFDRNRRGVHDRGAKESLQPRQRVAREWTLEAGEREMRRVGALFRRESPRHQPVRQATLQRD